MLQRLLSYKNADSLRTKEERREYLRKLDTNTDAKKEIRILAKHFLGKEVMGCGLCMLSAHTELLLLNKEKVMSKFKVAKGTLLHDPINRDASKRLTEFASEEVMLYHLAFNPQSHPYFERTPDSDELAEMIEAFINNTDGVAGDAVNLTQLKVSQLKQRVQEQKFKVDTLRKEYYAEEEKLDKLTPELEAVETTLVGITSLGGEKPKAKTKGKVPAKGDTVPLVPPVVPAEDGAGAPVDTDTVQALATIAEDVGSFIAAGMTDEDIAEALVEAVAAGTLTAEQLTEMVTTARAAAEAPEAPETTPTKKK